MLYSYLVASGSGSTAVSGIVVVSKVVGMVVGSSDIIIGGSVVASDTTKQDLIICYKRLSATLGAFFGRVVFFLGAISLWRVVEYSSPPSQKNTYKHLKDV